MDKWMTLSQAFENLGDGLAVDCENAGTACEDDSKFNELYTVYVTLLEIMKTTRRVIANRFDDIDRRYSEEQ